MSERYIKFDERCKTPHAGSSTCDGCDPKCWLDDAPYKPDTPAREVNQIKTEWPKSKGMVITALQLHGSNGSMKVDAEIGGKWFRMIEDAGYNVSHITEVWTGRDYPVIEHSLTPSKDRTEHSKDCMCSRCFDDIENAAWVRNMTDATLKPSASEMDERSRFTTIARGLEATISKQERQIEQIKAQLAKSIDRELEIEKELADVTFDRDQARKNRDVAIEYNQKLAENSNKIIDRYKDALEFYAAGGTDCESEMVNGKMKYGRSGMKAREALKPKEQGEP